ncbi:2205_t:CDS:10, partial [Acaulospora colombiana]
VKQRPDNVEEGGKGCSEGIVGYYRVAKSRNANLTLANFLPRKSTPHSTATTTSHRLFRNSSYRKQRVKHCSRGRHETMVHVKSFLPDPPELPPTNIHAFFIEPRETVDKDYVFLIDGLTGEQWTRSYFKERVDRARTALDMGVERKGLGLVQSNMVAILSENCIEYVTLIHALCSLAVPFAPCSAYATPYELAHSLRLSGASHLFVHSDKLKIGLQAAKEVGIPASKVYVLQGKAPQGFITLQQLIKRVELEKIPIVPIKPVTANQLAFVLFSSGTTGLPKERCMDGNDNGIRFSPPEGHNPVLMGYLPIYHTFGLHTICLRSLLAPATIVIIPRWNTDLVLDLIPKYRVTTLPSVPSIIHQLASSPKLAKTDMSSVLAVTSGAAYLPLPLADKIQGKVGTKSPVLTGYGLSEVGQLGGKWTRVPDSTGALIPGMEARTVREDGTEADYNESGELWLKGKNVAMGYYRNPKATAETTSAWGSSASVSNSRSPISQEVSSSDDLRWRDVMNANSKRLSKRIHRESRISVASTSSNFFGGGGDIPSPIDIPPMPTPITPMT